MIYFTKKKNYLKITLLFVLASYVSTRCCYDNCTHSLYYLFTIRLTLSASQVQAVTLTLFSSRSFGTAQSPL